MRDNSSYKRNSNVRAGLLPGGKFTGPSRNNSKPGGRVQSKTPERQKSELVKLVESQGKDIKKLEKGMEEMKEMLKGNVINGHFVEDVVIDVNFINVGAARIM